MHACTPSDLNEAVIFDYSLQSDRYYIIIIIIITASRKFAVDVIIDARQTINRRTPIYSIETRHQELREVHFLGANRELTAGSVTRSGCSSMVHRERRESSVRDVSRRLNGGGGGGSGDRREH